jgi:hypothetical protein
MHVAVIGTGIAGGAAAWTLSKRYSVTVYDRELRPGGHSHTVTIDYDRTPIAVDVGFIVDNELNYPHLTAVCPDTPRSNTLCAILHSMLSVSPESWSSCQHNSPHCSTISAWKPCRAA